MNAKMIFLHALTPVHVGTGQAAAVIDLPVAREAATDWPIIPASGLKGVLRDTFSQEQWAEQAFGSIQRAGVLAVGDQRILCLPVRSFFGTFAYVTCPLALQRLRRDYSGAGLQTPIHDVPSPAPGSLRLTPDSLLVRGEQVLLEDLDLAAVPCDMTAEIGRALAEVLFPLEERDSFVQRIAIAPDDLFTFLAKTATEVRARIRLEEDSKTVTGGGLWYEEAVPAEAIFSGPLLDTRTGAAPDILDHVVSCSVQIGGKSSIGQGFCRMVVTP